MSKLLLHSSRRRSILRCTAFVATLFSSSSSPATLSPRFPLSLSSHSQTSRPFQSPTYLSLLAFHSSSSTFDSKSKEDLVTKESRSDGGINNQSARIADEDYPSGDYEFAPITGWRKFLLKLKMLVASPLEGVRKGSVLRMKLRGRISDQLKSPFSQAQGLSLPQVCENFLKAAYDPRISGIYLDIDNLNCGWGKVEEIQRQILNFKRSGVLDNVGIEPQIERIGKYKSAEDQLTRRTMSEETCEMLSALLDSIYANWLEKVSSLRGKKGKRLRTS